MVKTQGHKVTLNLSIDKITSWWELVNTKVRWRGYRNASKQWKI